MLFAAAQVLLDNHTMRGNVAEVCDSDPKAAAVLCRVSAHFLPFGREIDVQSVSVVDSDGKDHRHVSNRSVTGGELSLIAMRNVRISVNLVPASHHLTVPGQRVRRGW